LLRQFLGIVAAWSRGRSAQDSQALQQRQRDIQVAIFDSIRDVRHCPFRDGQKTSFDGVLKVASRSVQRRLECDVFAAPPVNRFSAYPSCLGRAGYRGTNGELLDGHQLLGG
jgi:hypothetical protein